MPRSSKFTPPEGDSPRAQAKAWLKRAAAKPRAGRKTLRIRYQPKDPDNRCILDMLNGLEYGQLSKTVLQALRVGAALVLERPLEALQSAGASRQSPARPGRFVARKLDPHELPATDRICLTYFPDDPVNESLQSVISAAGWRESNAVCLKLLRTGLASLAGQRALLQSPKPVLPAAPPAVGGVVKDRPGFGETKPLPPQPRPRRDYDLLIGVDPVRVTPKSVLQSPQPVVPAPAARAGRVGDGELGRGETKPLQPQPRRPRREYDLSIGVDPVRVTSNRGGSGRG